MQVRHRTPAVFTLYMVDVFCCALGCVILLWLVSAREARRRGAESSMAVKQRDEARVRLASVEGEATARAASEKAARQSLEAQRSRAAALQAEAKRLTERLVAAEAALRASEQTRQSLTQKVAAGDKAQLALRQELAAASARLAGLTREGDDHRAAAQRDAEQVATLGRRARELEKELERHGVELAAAKLRAEVAADHKQKAEAQARELAARAEAEKRFAGVPLTGERVVFLLDMSGSMRLRDPLTEDPAKWPAVCETLGRLIESLPGLKQYQVILFSDRVRYPLGGEGRWLDHDAKAGAKAAIEALRRVRPDGETNLYAALDEAFRYRAQGMDTIYLLSDGLPTAGEGMPTGGAAMKEADRAVYLTRHVRQTLKNVWNREGAGQPRVRLNTVGFYYDTPEVGAFLWTLAREHGGNFVGLSRP